MTADTLTLLARLAFDPSAHEGEAIAAFKKLRAGGYKPDAVVEPKSQPSVTSRWSLTLKPHSFDAFLNALFEYKKTPYFRIEYPEGLRKKLLDPWKFTIAVTLPTRDEMFEFEDFLDELFEEIKKP